MTPFTPKLPKSCFRMTSCAGTLHAVPCSRQRVPNHAQATGGQKKRIDSGARRTPPPPGPRAGTARAPVRASPGLPRRRAPDFMQAFPESCAGTPHNPVQAPQIPVQAAPAGSPRIPCRISQSPVQAPTEKNTDPVQAPPDSRAGTPQTPAQAYPRVPCRHATDVRAGTHGGPPRAQAPPDSRASPPPRVPAQAPAGRPGSRAGTRRTPVQGPPGSRAGTQSTGT